MKRIAIILATLALIVAVVATVNIVRYVHLQSRNMRAAGDHIPKVLAVLRGDRRFEGVTFEPYTAFNGCLGVFGSVASETDRQELKQRVDAINPPVFVSWHVQLASSTQPATTPAEAK